MDAESLRNSGMLSMLTSAEGREKLQSLAAKVRDRGNNVWRCGCIMCWVVICCATMKLGIAVIVVAVSMLCAVTGGCVRQGGCCLPLRETD
jgi:hypothetical protein